MSGVIVNKKAIIDLVREVFNNDVSTDNVNTPVNVNNVVDPSAMLTDANGQNHIPANKVELQVAIKALSDDLGDEEISNVYKNFVGAIQKDKDKDEKKMKKDTQVENLIRLQVRRMLDEGILAPGEEYAPESEVKSWLPGMPVPSGYEVGYADKKGKKQTLIKKAKMPSGMSVTSVPAGTSTARQQKMGKYQSQLKKTLSTMEDDDEDRLGSESQFKRWIGTIIPVSDAVKYRDVYIDAYQKNVAEGVKDAEWNMTTETSNFEKMFKEAFGKTFRNFCLPLGAAIKERLSSNVNYSAVDVGAGTDVAQQLADEFGISRSGIKNLEDQVLAKFALGMLAEMPSEEEVNVGLEPAPVAEGVSNIVGSYINVLARNGKLGPVDVRLLREHPEMVVDLPGFQTFLKNKLRRILH